MQNKFFFIFFFGLFFFQINTSFSQQKDIYNFSADKITYSQDNNIIEAIGNVVAKNQEGKQISADKIVSIIETINDKQFTTGKSSSTDIEGETKSSSPSTTTVTETKTTKIHVEVPETNWEMPNIFRFFSHLLN